MVVAPATPPRAQTEAQTAAVVQICRLQQHLRSHEAMCALVRSMLAVQKAS